MENETKREKARRLSAILLLGLFGQIAWAIENNYINLWVFSQSHNTDHIAWMTTGSAIVATLTTFFVGALSDRLGKRKPFIAGGYSIWGIFVFLFGVMSLSNMEVLGGSRATGLVLVGVMNLVVDCVMTFFGSSANDACYNAFVTEATSKEERPFLETLLSVMPLLSLAIMMLAGLILGIPDASKSEAEIAGPWFVFFLIFGALTTLVGIVSFFLLPKDTIAPSRKEGYFSHMVQGFKPSSVKANPSFYIALLSFLCFNVAVDAFLPYFMVYFQNLPSFAGGNFYVALGSIMGAASLLVILLGAFLERIGKRKVLVPAVLLMGAGAMGLYFSGDNLGLSIALGILLIGGYLVGTASLGAEIRDQTPAGDVGAYQSVRMVFAVMLPMVIGSNLSALVFDSTYVNDFGETVKAPDRNMWIVVAIAAVLTLAPILWLILRDYKAGKRAEKGT